MVQALGDQFLAGAALPDHQHGPVERRRTARALDRVEERIALANELLGPFQRSSLQRDLTDCWWQIPPFGKEFWGVICWKSTVFAEFLLIRGFGTPLV